MRVDVENAENGFIVGYWKQDANKFEEDRVNYICGSITEVGETLKKVFEASNEK